VANEAVFDISLQGNAPQASREAAASIAEMRDRLIAGEKAIKTYSETLRRLRGSSEEVKTEKAALQAKINGLRDDMSALSVSALKSGVALEDLSTRTKAASSDAGGMGSAIEQVGGPVTALQSKLAGLAKIVGNGSVSSGVFRLALVGVAAAVIAVTVAAAGLAAKMAAFVVEGANAARTTALFREAAAGGAANGAALGTQIEALAGKVSTSREELAGLANELARTGMRGETIVDTFNAVAQASDAMGSEAANKIRGLVEAGRLSQRLFVSRESLVGTGVAFDEVAERLAASMKIGVKDARAALAEGRVPLGLGAKVLRETIEKKFGELNARKMLDLGVQSQKFRESLLGLTKDVKLEPLLKGVEGFRLLLDESTVSGAALKKLVTVFGNGAVAIFGEATPIAEQFFKGLVIGGLTLTVAVLKMRKSLNETFGDTKLLGNIDLLGASLKAGQYAAVSIAAVLGLVAVAVGAVGYSAAASIGTMQKLWGLLTGFHARLSAMSWSDIGTNIVDGIVSGVTGGARKLKDAVVGLADTARKAFTTRTEIRSPSRVFQRDGRQLPAGTAKGVEQGAGLVRRAVDRMVPEPPIGGAKAARAGGGGAVERVLRIVLEVKGDGPRDAFRAPNVRAELLEVLRELAASEGVMVVA
jgi:hypothetical protein